MSNLKIRIWLHAPIVQLKEQNRTIKEENQMLKFKVDVLLDMVAGTDTIIIAVSQKIT